MDNVIDKERLLRMTGVFDVSEKDIREFSRLVSMSIPGKLYRYRSPSCYNFDALEKGYEWLSYPDDYNDPFDARIFYDSFEVLSPLVNKKLNDSSDHKVRAFLEILTGKSFIPDDVGEVDEYIKTAVSRRHGYFPELDKIVAKFREKADLLCEQMTESADEALRDKILICSLSTRLNNDLMWAHYADSHKGFCLEYDSPLVYYPEQVVASPVIYREQPVNVTSHIKRFLSDQGGVGVAAMGSAIVKSSSWEYEDEWRLLKLSNLEERKFYGLKLSKVVVGCKAADDTIEKVRSICQVREVPVYQMRRSRKEFSMEIGSQIS